MTVSTTESHSGPYLPNGLTTDFPFEFAVGSSTEVVVFLDGEEVDSNSYAVELNDPDETIHDGGTIVFWSAPTGAELYVWSNPDFTQEIGFRNAGPFLPASHDEANDRGAIRDIWLKGETARSIRFPVGETAPELPAAADRLGSYFAFDADGDPVMASGTGADAALRTDLASSGGAALSGFLGGAGATARSVQARLRDTVSVKDFGAVGDNVADDGPAIAAAIATGAATIFFPDGTYRLYETIPTPQSGQRFVGSGKARIRRTSSATFRTKPIFLLQDVTDVTIENLELEVDEAGAFTKHYAVHMRATALGDTQRITIRGCKIITTYVFVERYCSHIRYQNNSLYGGDLTIGGFATGGVVDLTTGVSSNPNGLIDHVWVEDCYFERTYGEAIDINWHTHNVTIARCHFHNCAADDLNEVIDIGSDSVADDTYNCQNIVMTDLLITDDANMVQSAIQIKGNSKAVTMRNVVIRAAGATPGTLGAGVVIWNSHSISIDGLIVEGYAYGLVTKRELASFPTDIKVTNFHITRYGLEGLQLDCVRSHCGPGTIDGTGSTSYGIDCVFLSKSSLIDIHIRDAGLSGIRFQASSPDNLVRGCDIETSTQHGIAVAGACDRCRFLGNHFRSNTLISLTFTSASDRCLIDGNVANGNGTNAFSTGLLTNSTIGSNITA